MSQDVRTPPTAEPQDLEAAPARRHPRLPPIAYPVLALAFGTALVWAFSRILLAVSRTELFGIEEGGARAAAAIALLMAMNVLVGAALVAYGQRVRRRPVAMPIIVLAGLVLIGLGGLANTVIGEEGKPKGGEAAQTIPLTASGIKFDKDQISVRPGGSVKIEFKNEDTGTQHNFALFTDDTGSQPIFQGPVIGGPATTSYSFRTPPPGEYFFRCDIHPTQMTGTFTVAEGGGGGAPGGGGPGGEGPPGTAALTAQNTTFAPASLTVTPAGGKVTIHFDNKDQLPHNVAVFAGSDSTGEVIFRGEVFSGPGLRDYSFAAPPLGQYFFHCDVHPQQMTGTITIEG